MDKFRLFIDHSCLKCKKCKNKNISICIDGFKELEKINNYKNISKVLNCYKSPKCTRPFFICPCCELEKCTKCFSLKNQEEYQLPMFTRLVCIDCIGG